MSDLVRKIIKEALDFKNLPGIQRIGALDYEDNTRHIRFKSILGPINLMIDYLSEEENIKKVNGISLDNKNAFYAYWSVFDNLEQYTKSTYEILINIYKSIVEEIKMFIEERHPDFMLIAGNLKKEEEQTFDLTQKGRIYKAIIEKHLSTIPGYSSIEKNIENEKAFIICKKEMISEIK